MRTGRRRRTLAVLTAAVLGTALSLFFGTSPASAARVPDPFSGSTPYLNPDYVAEVRAQATADGSTAEATVANYQTAIWMDHIGAIAGDSSHMGLQAQLTNAAGQASASNPVLVEIVIYDLPGRDCAALASNGELPATSAGLSEYESQYIDPIASIEGNASFSNLRIVNIIEPDSLPNEVTNQSIAACATATPFYEQGIEYALNKLHAIGWTYQYLDIAHSAWLGWSSNFNPAIQEFHKVAAATTAGVASIDGFISNTANYTPTTEPFMTATETVGGQQVESANFYQFDPYIDELHYDQDMRTGLISAGFPNTIGMLIDTSRNGWGGPDRPTAASTSTDLTTFVNQSKIDKRSFRGDWCNQEGAGIGARPQDQPVTGIQAFVWIKPPGESDGTYPAFSGSGDPHCDPNGTNTDGNNNQYPTGSFPDSPAAGNWFAAEFQQLVANAFPSLGGSGGGDTTPPSAPTNLAHGTVTSTTVPLTWTASTDNVGVTGYQVFRGSTQVGTTATTSFTDTGLSPSTTYSYTVRAVDAAGNVSNPSNSLTVTTASSGGGGGGASCTATYLNNDDWGAGFVANVSVTNTGTSPTSSWTVTWTWGGNQTIVNIWNASLTQNGASERAANMPYNNVIPAGGNTTFGFQASYSGTNTAPTLTCTAS